MAEIGDGSGNLEGVVEGESDTSTSGNADRTDVTPIPPEMLVLSKEGVPTPVDGDSTEANEAQPLPAPPKVFAPKPVGLIGFDDLSGAIKKVVGEANTAPVEVGMLLRSVRPTLVPVSPMADQVTGPMAVPEAIPSGQMDSGGTSFVFTDPWQQFANLCEEIFADIAPGVFSVIATSLVCGDDRDSLVVCVNNRQACVQVFSETNFHREVLPRFPQSLRYAAAILWAQMISQISNGALYLRMKGKLPSEVICEPESVRPLPTPAQVVNLPNRPQMNGRLALFVLLGLAICTAASAIIFHLA